MAKEQFNRYFQGPKTDHFNGRRFFNPGGIAPLGFGALLKWKFLERAARWPKAFISPHEGNVPEPRVEGTGMRVTMVGHASLLIQTAGLNILTDPVWSKRASPLSFVGPKRVNDPGILLEDLPEIDVVLITHNHYDHLNLTTFERLHARHSPTILTPIGNDTIMRKHLRDGRFIATDWGDRTEISPDVTIDTEPCHHWSARGRRDRRMALWAAFVINTPHGKIYHIGDTGFHDGIHYAAAARKHGEFRLAILPIGAYEPRWFMRAQHQNPDEAVKGMQIANAAYAVGHHWGTFQLTDEAIDAPPHALSVALDEAGVARERFPALRPGEIFNVPER